ncbi:MAG: tyrosine-type recombinase/integrase [Dehalococcoidales bacterium]|nr:MAG: tyrosine-type recombinase/integrase [Dehalococcoidales bacterium]
MLKEHREHMIFQRLQMGSRLSSTDLIFSKYDGSLLIPNTVSKNWTALAKKLGIQSTHLRASRHTHASLLLKQGIQPKVVQERLGHASAIITQDIYSHVMQGFQESAAEKFDAALQIQ